MKWLKVVLFVALLTACGVPDRVSTLPDSGRSASPSPVAAADRAIAGAARWAVANTTTTTVPAPTVTSMISAPTSHGGDLYAFLAQCETATTWTWETRTYTGAYGFTHQTWLTYREPGMPDRASEASPEQQTAVARHLHDLYGLKPWPACGVRARAHGFS